MLANEFIVAKAAAVDAETVVVLTDDDNGVDEDTVYLRREKFQHCQFVLWHRLQSAIDDHKVLHGHEGNLPTVGVGTVVSGALDVVDTAATAAAILASNEGSD